MIGTVLLLGAMFGVGVLFLVDSFAVTGHDRTVDLWVGAVALFPFWVLPILLLIRRFRRR